MATPPRAAAVEAQRAIIARLLEIDEEFFKVSRDLVLQGLLDLRNLQLRGDPAIRASIAKSLAAPVTKAIFEVGDDDSNSDLRAEMHEMMEEMRGEIMGHGDDGKPPARIVPKK